MKSQKPSSTQINSRAPLLSECTETGLDFKFIFESLDSKNKTVQASKPIQVFKNLKDLDNFLSKNQDLLGLESAGIAGYLGYDGECEIAVYQHIEVANHHYQERQNVAIQKNWKVIKPDDTDYIAAVKKCQEYIKEGDIYQANIAHKFRVQGEGVKGEGVTIYERLKALNPAPYSGYMDFEDFEIISSSPESFLKFTKQNQDWLISSSPIKGTAKLNELSSLMESSKERAEHIMIVDLIRNDLGRICQPGTIKADELMSIHKFKNLYHYISTVTGLLRHPGLIEGSPNKARGSSTPSQNNKIPNFEKIFAATFPGGSITGTPKIRCMEIIKELESGPRGLFTGAMGYFRFQDGGEFNILIRTIIHDKKTDEWSFHTGSGITAYSDPEKELEESYLKAEKLVEVFNGSSI